METAIQILIPLITGLIGVAIGYGALRNQVKTNSTELTKLQGSFSTLLGNPGGDPLFIRRTECDSRSEHIQEQIEHIKRKIDDHKKATRGVQNFARWMLTTKEHMSPIDAEKILNPED